MRGWAIYFLFLDNFLFLRAPCQRRGREGSNPVQGQPVAEEELQTTQAVALTAGSSIIYLDGLFSMPPFFSDSPQDC